MELAAQHSGGSVMHSAYLVAQWEVDRSLLKPGWEGPCRIAWDSIHKSEYFIEEASASNLPLDWCLEIAANALWAAVTVFGKYILYVGGSGRWFKKNGEIVLKIRNAVEHFDFEVSVGQSFSPEPGAEVDSEGVAWHTFGTHEGEGETVETFVSGIGPSKMPISDVLSELGDTCRRVKKMVGDNTGTEYFKFHVEPGNTARG